MDSHLCGDFELQPLSSGTRTEDIKGPRALARWGTFWIMAPDAYMGIRKQRLI